MIKTINLIIYPTADDRYYITNTVGDGGGGTMTIVYMVKSRVLLVKKLLKYSLVKRKL